MGFNASQGSKTREPYDLPFIINRSRLTVNRLKSPCKYFYNGDF